MSAEEGRDYRHDWPSNCLDGGDHDPDETYVLESYLPLLAYCLRCSQRSVVTPLLHDACVT